MSGEILRPYPVSCNEFCVGKLATQCFNQFDEMSRDRLDNGAHPQGNRGTLPRVQAKCFIINILRHDVTQLQSQWASGLGMNPPEFCGLKGRDNSTLHRTARQTPGLPAKIQIKSSPT